MNVFHGCELETPLSQVKNDLRKPPSIDLFIQVYSSLSFTWKVHHKIMFSFAFEIELFLWLLEEDKKDLEEFFTIVGIVRDRKIFNL